MLRSRSLGRSGSQLFVTTKWIYRAIRTCIIDISIIAIFRGWHFENGLVGVKYDQISIANIIHSHTDPSRRELQDEGFIMSVTVLIVSNG